MFQTVKAMAVAGIIATGLPLLTETASADGITFVRGAWNIVIAESCDTWIDAQTGTMRMWIYNGNDLAYVNPSLIPLSPALFTKVCYEGWPVEAFLDSNSGTFTSFYYSRLGLF